MDHKTIPLDWFVCPVTKEILKRKNDVLYSSFGEFKKNKEYGFYDFIPYGLEDLKNKKWKEWNKLQENAQKSYVADPYNNLSIGERKDSLEFMHFCNFRRNVLDVGCGPQANPTHIAYSTNRDIFFTGIDPLVGEQPRSFAFVSGLGEYLPFRDTLFHQVLFVTALDHFIDPLIPLMEAKRVVRADGEICVWIGEKSKKAPKPAKNNEWYEKLEIPEGAEDPFHFRRLSAADFEMYVKQIGLKVREKKVLLADRYGKNLFYKLVK
ncbi:MAG: class I SAM-dependent methyltransferase [Candidatus Hodarchaeota archaeon]